MSYDVILVKFLPKNAQVLERDLAKLQNWDTSRYFRNFNFSGFSYNKIWLKIKLIWNKNLLVKGLIVKKLEDRQKYVISHECAMRWSEKNVEKKFVLPLEHNSNKKLLCSNTFKMVQKLFKNFKVFRCLQSCKHIIFLFFFKFCINGNCNKHIRIVQILPAATVKNLFSNFYLQ